MLRVTPLYGSSSHHPDQESIAIKPLSTLIEYDNRRILVDLGWDASCYNDVVVTSPNNTKEELGSGGSSKPQKTVPLEEHLQKLREIVSTVDVIVLCDSTLLSIGGLPLLYTPDPSSSTSNSTKTPMIYATFPTTKMGQMTL
eukprot:CAMPEP_0194367606 /NCGR_PEP_ID=MMETSP0174-20130528/15730_1 /TAXON_ID=216777 /ORGANISM="Proboscia alata, Strain PI-D3" /LENGTH=141 /DNA_ID=CAMNT_0039143469 /DNA_START=108 /DNA_END=530 /DNA_ORIENTATION=+